MKPLALLLICCALTQDLFATIEPLDERGNPLPQSSASATLRLAPGQVVKSLYGKRVILLSKPHETGIRHRYSANEKGATRVPWVRLTATLGELTNSLAQITGETFDVVKEDAPEGILLARADAPGLALPGLQALKSKDPEAFLIQSDGTRKLYLVGNSDLGIQHAVYTYLDMIGCRWFLAGDNWTIIPKLPGIGVKIHALCAPAFTSRCFFGTGGVHSLRHLYDPEAEATTRWINWTERNRFGASYRTAGHHYQDFIQKNRALFEAHPEYRPEVKGVRVPVSPNMKLCYSNPEVIALFVKDRVAACRKIIEEQAPKSMFCVSVEPSDGYEHCECAECVKLGSITDRVFSLANHVARAIRPLSPYAYVNLYAYNMHSPPATIPLEPNIFVQVCAYGFNTSGLPSDQLIQAWGRKCAALGVYDYWCIPQWGYDMPSLSFNDRLPKRVKFWHANHVLGFNLETTYSGGAVGPALYMVSRLGWEPDQDPRAVFDDFYAKAFGSARPPMQRMLERWSLGWHLVESEIADSFKDLNEALRLTSDPAVKKRIQDYLGYVEFLRLRYEYVNTDRVKERDEWIARCRQLIHHLYRIHQSCMAHTVWTSGQFFWGTKGVNRPTTEEELDIPTKRSSAPLSDEELDAILKTGLKKYVPVEYDRVAYDGDDYVPLHPVGALSSKIRETPVLLGDESHKLGLWFWASDNAREAPLSICFQKRPEQTPYDNFYVFFKKGQEKVFTTNVPQDGQWHDYKVPIQRAGLYGIRILDNHWGAALRFPENLPLGIQASFLRVATLDRRNLQDNRAFFLVPARLKTAAFALQDPDPLEGLEVRDISGKPIPKKRVGTTAVFELNNGPEPRLCELIYPATKENRPLVPLNISPMLSFLPDQALVPVHSSAGVAERGDEPADAAKQGAEPKQADAPPVTPKK